jgi:glycosyltransferase involved in cell wall biosynthesis
VDDLRAHGIPVVILPHLVNPIRPYQDFRAFWEVVNALKEVRPDLVTAHGAKVGILGRLAARVLRLPLVVTVHGWACAPGTPPLQALASRWLERTIGPLASKVITVSEFDRRFGVDTRLVSENRVVTVHNGMPDIAVELRAVPGGAPVRLVMVARFEPQKDHATLLRALGGLQTHPWNLDLVGDGPLRPAMEALADSLGIRERVNFLGQRRDVDRILSQSHISTLVSNWEGFPLSILEAMRAGLPVVATGVGGVAEAIEDGKTGYVVAQGDPDVLRDRIERLLTSSALRVQLGTNGRRRYEQHFTLDRLVANTLTVYRNVLAGKNSHRAPSRARIESSTAPNAGDVQVGG